MKRFLKDILSHYFLPRWIVLLFDLTVMGVVCIFSIFLIGNFSLENFLFKLACRPALLNILLLLVVYLLIKPHHNIIRHTTIKDFSSVISANLIGSVGLLGISALFRNESWLSSFLLPYPIIIINFFITIFILLSSRVLIKYAIHSLFEKSDSGQNTMIYGVGRMGMVAHNILVRENLFSYNVIGFIDDNTNLHGKKINGIRVYSSAEAFNHVMTKKRVKEIIIAVSTWEISLERKQNFIHSCLDKKLKIKEISDVNSWIKGSKEKVQIQNIRIEDLLGREPITIDTRKISAELNGKRILVTGAAGSIGSEIVRKLLLFTPGKIVLVDQSESGLYNLHNELLASFGNVNIEVIVGNVLDQNRMRLIFENNRPEIIFHASAYKHVPLMEAHPYEAVNTNIGGTKVIADLSVLYGVKKFVMISTDKAVNPTNVMGASKRICEIYIQSLSQIFGIKTQFVTTRFGNVLGSNGSVVPLFKSQIEKGGPVTITHKDITRYFMTIPEACQLVLEAGFMGHGNEIYVFDMGTPIKIFDLAKKMIYLSGLIPYQDIKIIETGLRPGEKLFEELLSSKENSKPTNNKKIKIANVRQYDHYIVNLKITEMLKNLGIESDDLIVARMKDLVEEFVSQNSKYEKLDFNDDKPISYIAGRLTKNLNLEIDKE